MKKVKLEKVIEVYSLEEMLADPEKKKRLLEFNQPSDFEEEAIMDDELGELTDWLESFGFKDVEIHYDLSGCQGSGASFAFSNVDIHKLVNELEPSLSSKLSSSIADGFQETLSYLIDYGEPPIFSSKWNSFANHYTHSKTVDIDYEYPSDILDESQTDSIVNEILDTEEFKSYIAGICETIQEIYEELAYQIYHKLESYWNWLHSEQAIVENLRANEDLEFTKDGKCFKPDIFDYPEYKCTIIDTQEEKEKI